jgi:hypothetical protein
LRLGNGNQALISTVGEVGFGQIVGRVDFRQKYHHRTRVDAVQVILNISGIRFAVVRHELPQLYEKTLITIVGPKFSNSNRNWSWTCQLDRNLKKLIELWSKYC